MLGIKIRNEFLSLFPQTALSFEMSHPIGIITDALDQISGGYSFPIDIPLDQVNVGIIGHVGRLDHDLILIQDEYCEVWGEGLLLYIGLATLTKATESSASLFMVFNEFKPLQDTALSSVDLGGARSIGEDEATRLAHAKDTAENPLDYDYVFCPVVNPIWKIDPSGVFTSVVASHLQNDWDTSTDEFVEGLAGISMPFIRMDYLLTRVFAHLGFTLSNEWQDTDELRLLLLYNNYSIYVDPDTWDTEINLVNHVPHRSCLDLIKAVIGTFALGIFPDPHDKAIRLIPFKTLIQSAIYEDITDRVAKPYSFTSDRNFISVFGYDIDTDDQLSIQYSGPPHPITTTAAGEGLTVRIMDAALEFFLRYVISDNTYYLIIADIPGLTASYVIQDQKRVTKTGSTLSYFSPLIPMWSSWDLNPDGYIASAIDEEIEFQTWLLPHIRHYGFSTHYTWVKKPQISFRTMFYRGMQPYDVGITGEYPMAGVTRYNIRGEEVGDYSLLWDREDGIYNQWWKLPYEMLASKKEVTRTLNFSIRDLVNFRFYNKYRIENQNYFITKLRFTLTARGLSLTEATMITTL